ncbi:MAG: hypothetical protein DME25_05660 [Verrucomicrobia bacterium]|nr:MAG: hypothetical protein DME25_05660 [Verrucomicrobiota bacterium]
MKTDHRTTGPRDTGHGTRRAPRRSRFTFHVSRFKPHGFTLIELMLAIGILAMVLAAIYSTWTAILRASKVGLDAAAAVQRARIAVRVLGDSLGSAEMFTVHQQRHPPGDPRSQYYAFILENGNEARLSFVARLAKSFPRSGKFGEFDVRRLTCSVEPARPPDTGRQLVLRQYPLLLDPDSNQEAGRSGLIKDEQELPLVLAKNVVEFQIQVWDARKSDWTDEWQQANALPTLVMITLKLADNAQSQRPQEEITSLVSLPAVAVAPQWQGAIGGIPPVQPPGVNPPGVVQPPNQQPLVAPPPKFR